MLEIERPKIECVEHNEDKTYAKFVMEPLERGFGTTLGNSIRRVLLSCLPGVAVTSVKIDGVLHEFATIPGVKEDVINIVLNLKSLCAKLYSEGEKTITLNAKGPGVITAGDVELDSEVEIINPDLVIATLEPGATLYMEITLKKGRGYVLAEKNKMSNMPIGVIPVDSLFTPVTKVNFAVENTRVGQITDFDKLTLEVWTNGSISADEATSLSAKILSEYLSQFINLTEHVNDVEIMVKKKKKKKKKKSTLR
eukprot:TRINITY_DN30391_c0_g1_i2.p2 TRINITY_DN30391_c0_g1~~TRINITY_DN30391_c0_g1_i2.p2  ORF type:complete len:253 (+),score=21.75 TRINITY_DN30391_c0_g1_i2:205-963(+)